MPIRLNLSGDSAETVDRGGQLAPGWCLAELEDVHEDDDKHQVVFKFKIVDGAGVNNPGMTTSYWLPDPEAAEDAKLKKAVERAKMVALRLGAISEGDFGQEEVEPDWFGAMGKQFFVQIAEPAKDQTFVGIAYSGIYPLDYWGTKEAPAKDPKSGKEKQLPRNFPVDLGKYRQAAGGGTVNANGSAAGGAAAPQAPAAPTSQVPAAAARPPEPANDPFAGI